MIWIHFTSSFWALTFFSVLIAGSIDCLNDSMEFKASKHLFKRSGDGEKPSLKELAGPKGTLASAVTYEHRQRIRKGLATPHEPKTHSLILLPDGTTKVFPNSKLKGASATQSRSESPLKSNPVGSPKSLGTATVEGQAHNNQGKGKEHIPEKGAHKSDQVKLDSPKAGKVGSTSISPTTSPKKQSPRKVRFMK